MKSSVKVEKNEEALPLSKLDFREFRAPRVPNVAGL